MFDTLRGKKSHSCEEGRAYFRISVWDLLMNLKNNYLLKNCCSGPIKNLRMGNGWLKNEKICWRYDHFTRVPKTKNIWGTVLEMGSETDNFWSFWAIFCPSTLPPSPPFSLTNDKIQFWKNEKSIWMSSFYLCAPKATTIWCMLPEISSATN